MKEFFFGHDPVYPAFSTQYASFIFYHDQKQKEAAEKMLKAEEERRGTRLFTQIRPANEFYMAEDYHQKYYLRGNTILYKDIKDNYQNQTEFAKSTSAARINGYLGGYLPWATNKDVLNGLGLSEQAKAVLENILAQKERQISCSY